jgi:YD repeat-containing protein
VALLHKDYTWSTGNGNVYVWKVVNTRNPGASPVQSASTQTLDENGNVTVSAVYDYGNLTTPAKTYSYTYLTDANYTNRYIWNRVAQVTTTPGGIVLVTNTYDAYGYQAWAMVSRTGAAQHDDTNYGTGMVYRGNVTSRSSLGGNANMSYESTGVVVSTDDGAGHVVNSAPSADTSYSLPGVLTPGRNGNLATTVTYAASWAVTSVTGPNGASGATTYDSYGRPKQTSIPDGAVTNYAYAYYQSAGANQQTATLTTGTASRWKRTTLDGFGRVTRVENGNGSTTVSQVDTQYAPCACSPLGKMSQVSMPYAQGGRPVWTTYGYDASGRTVSVTAPDGSVNPATNWVVGQTYDANGNAGVYQLLVGYRNGDMHSPGPTAPKRWPSTPTTSPTASATEPFRLPVDAPGST